MRLILLFLAFSVSSDCAVWAQSAAQIEGGSDTYIVIPDPHAIRPEALLGLTGYTQNRYLQFQLPQGTPDVGPLVLQPSMLPGWPAGTMLPSARTDTQPDTLRWGFWIRNPVIGPDNIGLFNEHGQTLKVDLIVGTERRTLTLLSKEIYTMHSPADVDVTAIIGTGSQDFRTKIEKGRLYRIHPSDGKYVISQVANMQP